MVAAPPKATAPRSGSEPFEPGIAAVISSAGCVVGGNWGGIVANTVPGSITITVFGSKILVGQPSTQQGACSPYGCFWTQSLS
jgi:hypothetical protein